MSEETVVLAVDDDPTVLKFMRVVCHHAEYDYHGAKSGEDALAMLQDLKPSIILLDVNMPDMDGIETYTKIKEDFPERSIPVIFLSAKRDMETINKATKRGATYLLKPIDPIRLLEKIESTVQQAREKAKSG